MKKYQPTEFPMLFKPVMTLSEIAELMGMTRERVRQIEQSALRNARKILRKKGYNPDAFFSDPRWTKPVKPDPNADESQYELMYEREVDDE